MLLEYEVIWGHIDIGCCCSEVEGENSTGGPQPYQPYQPYEAEVSNSPISNICTSLSCKTLIARHPIKDPARGTTKFKSQSVRQTRTSTHDHDWSPEIIAYCDS